jgi:hypothetical protein
MKKYIVSTIKDTIEAKKFEWAKNYVAKAYQESLNTSDSKKQVESATLNMQVIESTIAFLEDMLAKESPKKK